MIFLGGFTAFFFFIGVVTDQMSQTSGAVGGISPITYFWASINPGALVLTLLSGDTTKQLFELVGIRIPLWIPYLTFYLSVTVLMILLAVKNLRAKMKRG